METCLIEVNAMKLTNYTDYSLRVLIFLATRNSNKLVNIKDIADTYSISKNHLMKVIYDLGKLGYVETIAVATAGSGSERLLNRSISEKSSGKRKTILILWSVLTKKQTTAFCRRTAG